MKIHTLILATLVLLAPFCAQAQTPVNNLIAPKTQFLNNSGVPLASGCVFTYTTGTSTPLATYTDSTGNTPNANPVILDAGGFASIWLAVGSTYRIKVVTVGGVNCSTGSQQYQIDGISGSCLVGSSCVTTSANNAFTGNNTFAGTSIFNGAVTVNAAMNALVGGSFVGSFSGAPTMTGLWTFNAGITSIGPNTISGGGSLAGTFSGTPTWSGLHTFSAGLTSAGPNVLKGLTTVRNFEQMRYVDDANTAGWAGADVCAQETSAEADLPSYGGTIDMRGLVSATFYSCTGTWAIGSGKAVVLYLPPQAIVITPSLNTPVVTVNSSSKILGVNGSQVYSPGGSSRLQAAGSGTGDLIQWTGSMGVMEDVAIVSNNARSILHLLASGSNSVLRNNFRNINILGGTAGEKCVELTADTSSALVSHNIFEALKTQQCDIGVQLDTSNNQGPTSNYFYGSALESTLTLTAAIKITHATTASNHFIGGHTSGTGPSIVTGGTANTFEFIRTEGTGLDVTDTGTGNSFIGDSFGTNCTTSIFAASAVLLGGWSNTNCPFDQFPRGVSVGTTLKVLGGVSADASGFKHKRGTAGCATAAAAGATCNTTITWTTAFPDANYTVQCGGRLVTSGVPVNGGTGTQLAASIVFTTVAGTAAAAQYTNIDCTAVHD